MSLGRTEALLGSLASIGLGSGLAIIGKRESGLAIAGAGLQGAIYCWNHKDENFRKLDFVRNVGAGALSQAALSASQFQKRLTSGLTNYIKENAANAIGRAATTICGQAMHQIIRGEKPNLILISASVGLGSAASQAMEWFADKAMPIVRNTLKGAVDNAVQCLVENALKKRPLTENLSLSAGLGGGVALIQAVPEMLLQNAPELPSVPAPQLPPVPSAQDRQYAASYAQYQADLKKYEEAKAYWKALLEPYFGKSDLTKMVENILNGKQVVVHVGIGGPLVYGSKKPIQCPVAPTPPVVVQAPPVVVAPQVPQSQPARALTPLMVFIPRRHEVKVQPDAVEQPGQPEELSDAEEEQLVVEPILENPNAGKIEKMKAQIARLESMIERCGTGKRGRAKRKSLSIQLRAFKSELSALKV